MTIFDTRSPAEGAVATLLWANPEADLWVANHNGEYAGLVEFVDGRFVVRSKTDAKLAECTSIPDAQQALAKFVETQAARIMPTIPFMVDNKSSRPFLSLAPRPRYQRGQSVQA